MLLSNPLERILGQASKVRILRFFIITDPELNGREIAAAIGLSHVKVHTALKELNQHDIVKMRHVGKSIMYRLNLKNEMVKKMLVPLFEKEARLNNMLAEIISKYLKPRMFKSVILFGSFALDRARPDSDFDILVVAREKKDIPVIEDSLKRAEISVTIGFGNHLAPIIMGGKEFKTRFKNKDKLVMNIAKEGKPILGDSINDLIKSDD